MDLDKLDSRVVELEKKLLNAQSSSELDFYELWKTFLQEKWLILGVTSFFSVAGVIFALLQPNIYRSEVLLAPAEENTGGGLLNLAGGLGGLANLAGLSLGSGDGDKTSLAIEVLRSRAFVCMFVEKHNLIIQLMAANGWDREGDALLIDEDIYSIEKNKWVRRVSPPRVAKPSQQEVYEEFIKHMRVTQEKSTGFITVSFEFFSPNIARQWVVWLIEDINLELKNRDVAEANRSIDFLSEQLKRTSIAEMQSMFYELIEEQTKTIMFAQVREEYVFKTVDPAVAPDKKIKPKRLLIVILSAMFGGVLSVLFVLGKRFFK